jgi:hypothetical protein
MMDNEICGRHIGHVRQMNLHVGISDILCRPACIGINDGISAARYDVNGMSCYARWG